MTHVPQRRGAGAIVIILFIAAATGVLAGQDKPTGQGFSFRTSVELINVTATVTDAQGRFVSGLTKEDFEIYEDGKLQTIAQFESERVPVSLGITLDTSGSMAGEKWNAAQAAVNRFVYDLLGDQDEVFLSRFDSRPELVRGWTSDRASIGQALSSLSPSGGTAMYDAVAEAVPLAQVGTRRKKALLIISDGNDTASRTDVRALQQRIRETELLVYAIGIDASGASPSPFPGISPGGSSSGSGSGSSGPTKTKPRPSAFPRAPVILTPIPQSSPSKPAGNSRRPNPSERFNVDALRAMTDDSGGRTEIILSARDLDPATAGIASELSRQYFIGYTTTVPKDGKWHTIDVKLKRGSYIIRARRGFIAG